MKKFFLAGALVCVLGAPDAARATYNNYGNLTSLCEYSGWNYWMVTINHAAKYRLKVYGSSEAVSLGYREVGVYGVEAFDLGEHILTVATAGPDTTILQKWYGYKWVNVSTKAANTKVCPEPTTTTTTSTSTTTTSTTTSTSTTTTSTTLPPTTTTTTVFATSTTTSSTSTTTILASTTSSTTSTSTSSTTTTTQPACLDFPIGKDPTSLVWKSGRFKSHGSVNPPDEGAYETVLTHLKISLSEGGVTFLETGCDLTLTKEKKRGKRWECERGDGTEGDVIKRAFVRLKYNRKQGWWFAWNITSYPVFSDPESRNITMRSSFLPCGDGTVDAVDTREWEGTIRKKIYARY